MLYTWVHLLEVNYIHAYLGKFPKINVITLNLAHKTSTIYKIIKISMGIDFEIPLN